MIQPAIHIVITADSEAIRLIGGSFAILVIAVSAVKLLMPLAKKENSSADAND